jgi:hypothetical protein
MKYLKAFESYGVEDYYKEITEFEYDDDICNIGGTDGEEDVEYMREKWVEFTDQEISKITEILSEKKDVNYIIDLPNFKFWKENGIARARLDIKPSKKSKTLENIMYIVKLEDDWYYLYDCYPNKFYKCDQFDGLLKCIKDNII